MTNGVNGMGANGPAVPLRSTVKSEANLVDRAAVSKPDAASGRHAPSVTSELRGIVRDISSQPPVDVSKVERLAGMIAVGSYKVDAAKLADAMISSEATGLKKG